MRTRRVSPFPVCPKNPSARPIYEMQLGARQAGDGLVTVLAALHFIGRPALHQLTRVRATIDKSSHRLVIALIDGDVPCVNANAGITLSIGKAD
jgi:hypothetical protein